MHVRVGEARPERGDHRGDVAGGESLGRRADDVRRPRSFPSTVPELLAGQAGLPPPPQKNTDTPPLTPIWPTWM